MNRPILFWLTSLVLAAALSSALTLAHAQSAQTEPRNPAGWPVVFSGSDLGFRAEGTDADGNPTGTFVVRIKGKWLEVSHAPGVRPLK